MGQVIQQETLPSPGLVRPNDDQVIVAIPCFGQDFFYLRTMAYAGLYTGRRPLQGLFPDVPIDTNCSGEAD